MQYFRHISKGKRVTIYPLVCFHVGCPQSDTKFIKETILRVKEDPTAKVVYMGDGGDCVTKLSKGSLYEQTLSIDEQLSYLVTLLKPIKDKLLFGVRGNHGNRVFKETGLSFDSELCRLLQMPFMGNACFWHLAVGRTQYSIFTHHGIDSGVSMATKINKAKKFEEIIAVADAIFTAHSHICCEIPPRTSAMLDPAIHTGSPLRWLTTHEYICGCAYDSRTGYAEDKGYPPILPAHLSVTFGGGGERAQSKSQTCQVWRKEP